MRTLPADQAERDRFSQELDCNFSVIAAAGAGKTTAITDRIVEVARRKPEWLPRLVVVTFTNRAADEMQQRARQRIFEAQLPLPTLTAFNRAFFGTIHSFCTKLLTAHGHHLGLPSRLELISDDEELWNDFVQRTDAVGESLSPENLRALLRHVQLRDVMELGRRGKLLRLEQRDIDCPPNVDVARLRNYQARAGSTRIEAMKVVLRDWEEQYNSDADLVPLIECTTGGKFEELWEATFREFNEWLSCCASKIAAEVQANYRQFRAEHGAVTFDDQIAFALALTNLPDVIARIRAKDYIVILDEAQDTDPQQFAILTEITRPPRATGRWIERPQIGPRPGRFCMVGDFQQSIYKDRADLKQYQRVHDALISSEAGEKLEFSVTFRLDQKQIDFVNESFREILNADGQVGFIELTAQPERLPGQVIRIDIAPELTDDASDIQKLRAEANDLTQWISRTGLENLRARSWEEVAILCPRKKWFRPIADALRRIGVDSQIQSETDLKADSPAHAWFAALITIMTQPRCSFEIVGVLRELFGISDHDLAIFSNRDRERFQIETATGGTDSVSVIVDLLARIHGEIADQPLFTAAQRIVEGTNLRERLRSLPTEDFDGLDAELDELLQSAASAEAEDQTLEEFGELLRANFTAEREARVPRPGAIQLITCQKAKGLEWDAVIVPFFSRQVYTADEDFPRIIAVPGEARAIVVFSKADVPSHLKDALKQAHVFEWERILYVALTRARHTLVLATDHSLFAKKDSSAHSDSLMKWFRADRGELNEERVAALEPSPVANNETRLFQGEKIAAQAETEFEFFPQGPLEKARTCAADFSLRFFPSSFTEDKPVIERTGADLRKEIEYEFRAATLPSAATRYGVWWHDFAEQVGWRSEPKKWSETFERNVETSPDPARSKREWQLLQKQIESSDGFARQLRDASLVRQEMPFFWRINGPSSPRDESVRLADRTGTGKCLEGIVDLALFNQKANEIFILDWKTNRIAAEKIDILRDLYRPQMAAYWQAISSLTNARVVAAMYSTATGQLVIYDPDELATEWQRLLAALG